MCHVQEYERAPVRSADIQLLIQKSRDLTKRRKGWTNLPRDDGVGGGALELDLPPKRSMPLRVMPFSSFWDRLSASCRKIASSGPSKRLKCCRPCNDQVTKHVNTQSCKLTKVKQTTSPFAVTVALRRSFDSSAISPKYWPVQSVAKIF